MPLKASDVKSTFVATGYPENLSIMYHKVKDNHGDEYDLDLEVEDGRNGDEDTSTKTFQLQCRQLLF